MAQWIIHAYKAKYMYAWMNSAVCGVQVTKTMLSEELINPANIQCIQSLDMYVSSNSNK